ncbi:aconitate hydratase [Clostridium cylindrosporum]|uniref:3-isopropylmalate dehydratase large subunit 1 n=1 Tax=Clostridium cylindrosporum DSM 605 TaxID=1121307 RepID=A0A0J8DB66_CLOCY|nr:aconitate hydratase [Clostridium cylindrosporum]KMT21523.1 3-isopropylmalate dehydratase large subunit 1 [Clostridium cylindrosporum DSM 605]
MGLTLAQKIIKNHLVSGEMVPGQEISIKIDQTLTQDSTGTMAYLQFEAMGVDRVKTKRSVAYIDHNTLQTGPENADDHLYIQSVAKKHGIYFSKPGNGICHQVQLERFGIPGYTLLGSDSHTPTGGGIGMIAIGAGGLDVAVAMGGGAYYITMPKIVKVELKGKLNDWVASKDIILELLRRLTVKGGVGRIFEYCGEGVSTLTVPERSTITNMGAELGATTSIFPSDDKTLEFLKAQGREEDFVRLEADADAVYDEVVEIDLSALEPLAACPHSPDNIKNVTELKGTKVNQILIGSCTNSSYLDLMKVAKILEGKTVAEHVSLAIAPGSKQVLTMLSQNGALTKLVAAGARILESACGPCIGMGQSPATDAVSLRTFNRNFEGRSGTVSAGIYIVSPELAAASAITGYIEDPRSVDVEAGVEMPKEFVINDNLVVAPAEEGNDVEVVRGPNIKEFPKAKPLADKVEGKVLTIVGDNITTDHIMPSNAKLLPFRSNIPFLSDHCLVPCDKDFPKKAKENGGGFIVGGSNYGQGSSREHAALVPLYLGVKGVLAKSFARIHMANLINNGIMPLVFENEADYDRISEGDVLEVNGALAQVETGKIVVENKTKGESYTMILSVTDRQKDMIKFGGLLNLTKNASK